MWLLQNYFASINWSLEMLVGCSQQETVVVGHMVPGWQNVNSTTSPETGREVSLPEITSSLAKYKCLMSQVMEEKEMRSLRGK